MTIDLLEQKFDGASNSYDAPWPLTFRFRTNAIKFSMQYSMQNTVKGNFPHTGLTTKEGLAIMYRCPDDHAWMNVDCTARATSFDVAMHHIVNPGTMFDILIYGPILSQLGQLKIVLPDDAQFIPLNDYDKNVLVLGGLHSFGIGCTTCCFSFPNILSRRLRCNVFTLASYEWNYLPKLFKKLDTITDKLPSIDAVILEVDYANQSDEIVEKHLVSLIKRLNCTKIYAWLCVPPNKKYKVAQAASLLKSNSVSADVHDCSYVYAPENIDMCTFSGNFINDTGNILLYKKMEDSVRSMLWNT